MQYPIDREHYRVRYPLTERPDLTLGDRIHPVADCSEFGLRYLPGSAPLPEVGEVVRGVIRFRRGQEAEVEGVVVRARPDGVALHLTITHIPLALMLDEQRWLRQNYPMHE